MSKKLGEIRKTIDKLDNQIHDLLMQRASLIVDICEEKRKHNKPVVQPAREAMMIRRLLGRHEGALPQAAIVGIWRELVGAVCMLQKGLHVHVTSGAGLEYCWDSAKDYFGSVLPMSRSASAVQAISAVREDDSNIAVVPWPQDGDDQPWWKVLMNQDSETIHKMRIVGALPYGSPEKLERLAQKSVVVAKIDYADSGDDHSFVIVEAPRDISRARIIDAFKERDLTIIGACSQNTAASGEEAVHLFEVGCFVGEHDMRLTDIEKSFGEQFIRCTPIGGYPVPPVFRQDDTAPVGQTREEDAA